MRGRIIAKADELFRARGYAKTTIANIAQELGMSTSNIYKFFSSKNAVVEATVELNIDTLRAEVMMAAQERGTHLDRIENIVLSIIAHHRIRFENEANLYELILIANEEKWGCIRRWKILLRDIVTELVEGGMRAGEFKEGNAAATAELVLDSLTVFLHPLLHSDCAAGEMERRARTHLRFLGRAMQHATLN